ncbi:GNAT family N-acetyltransferase [Flexivirga sp. ID2601S]|uniref:GNAT family N-acetyltransferase n=1 Tax=Flexivirga aerilata TaxID=1656889 RepID=A0A849AJ91_9MICO|nr:GNAT family N-acetyltransferase [Flexivirga aerilata]NNG39606.1 GNAT family N-acetyltransferase [Flexivirga aerilata]
MKVESVGHAPDPATVRALTRLVGDLVSADAALGWTSPPAQDEIEALLAELAGLAPDDAYLLLARVDGEVAGFGYWRRYSRPTHRPHADLEKLAVAAEFSGRGVGRLLLRALIERARAAGIEQLTLDFRGDNAAAERLYLSAGFREYGRLPDFVAPDAGRRLDKVFHVLDLRHLK